MALSINSITLPDHVKDNGLYLFFPFNGMRDNGEAQTVTTGLGEVTWTYSTMYKETYLWWVETLLNDAAYLEAAAVLLDNKQNEVSFSRVTVRYPTYDGFRNGLYINAVVKIDTMVKAP